MVDRVRPEGRKHGKHEGLRTILELAKWILVLWLLWPLRHAAGGPVAFTRIALGILLFVIFAGKLFYDTVIMGILRRRRTSVRQDLISMLGITLGIALVVGMLMLFVGFVFVELFRMIGGTQQE